MDWNAAAAAASILITSAEAGCVCLRPSGAVRDNACLAFIVCVAMANHCHRLAAEGRPPSDADPISSARLRGQCAPPPLRCRAKSSRCVSAATVDGVGADVLPAAAVAGGEGALSECSVAPPLPNLPLSERRQQMPKLAA